MSAITLAKALQVFDSQVGTATSRECLIDDLLVQVEWMLLNGGGEVLREWHLPLHKGLFTFPYDLEAPIKYRIGDAPGFGLGVFNSPYYSYSSGSIQNCCNFSNWGEGSFSCEVLANTTPTQFQPPKTGGFVLATTTLTKDLGKKIMVGGKQNGMAIAPLYNGYKVAGEVLTVYHQEDNKKKHSQYIYDEITSVTKDLTCGYIMLSGIECCQRTPFFLSHYHPDEETPQYQQGRINGCAADDCIDTEVHLLGRINPSIRYIRDEQILPITSFGMLDLLAKRCRYDKAGDFNLVAVQEARLKALIRSQVMYQQKTGQDISFDLSGSGASLTNA